MWLDVSILFESSKALDAAAMGEISGTFLGIFGAVTISQSLQQASHIAVNTFSPNDTVTDLSTYQNLDDLQMRFALIAGQTSNLDPSDPPSTLSQAIGVFDGPGRRSYARKVIIFVASSLSIGSDSDIVRLAQQFQANYGVFIVVNYVPPHLAPVPHICDLATPGMCFIVLAGATDTVVSEIQSGLCAANCFCKRNDYQYVSGTTDAPIEHAQCLHVVVAPTSWNAAHLICQSQNSLLTQVFDQDKMKFVTTLSMQILGSDKTFVGLKYNDTASPNDWYWETRNGFVQIAGPADTMWDSGSPNRTLGDCVRLQAAGGFNLKFISTDCTTDYHSYTCQYDACDTDNFCPTALGADETAVMHMTPSQYVYGLNS